MVHKKKTKSKIGPLIAGFLLLIFLSVISYPREVDIIYFTSPTCSVASHTDDLMKELGEEFGDKISIRTVIVNLDGDDSEKTTKLMEKYGVKGIPTIIINGKESASSKVKTNICRKFIIKPGACNNLE